MASTCGRKLVVQPLLKAGSSASSSSVRHNFAAVVRRVVGLGIFIDDTSNRLVSF